MPRYVSLLRGVNVSGARRIPMADLRDAYGGLGFEGVVTYVASGNVAFTTQERDRQTIVERIRAAILEGFGHDDVDVFLRTRDELAAIIDANPFPEAEAAPTTLHVVFLDADPDAERLASFDAAAAAPDALAAGPGVVYLHTPNGAARANVDSRSVERLLGVRGTARNWRSVRRLHELTEDD